MVLSRVCEDFCAALPRCLAAVRRSRVGLRTVEVMEAEERSEEHIELWYVPFASRSQGDRADET